MCVFIFIQSLQLLFSTYLLYILLTTNIENKEEYLNNFQNNQTKSVYSVFRDYTSLRCLYKKKCCYILFIITLIYDILKLLILFYIINNQKYELFYYFTTIVFAISMIITLLRISVKINLNQVEFMCPMTFIDIYNNKKYI